MRRLADTDLWAATTELPEGSRVEYQIEIRRGEHYERFNDPLNPRARPLADGVAARCAPRPGYAVAGLGRSTTRTPGPARCSRRHAVQGAAPRRSTYWLYLPARYSTAQRYPLLVVHDGGDYLHYAAMKTVLDNLIHRLDVAAARRGVRAAAGPAARVRQLRAARPVRGPRAGARPHRAAAPPRHPRAAGP